MPAAALWYRLDLPEHADDAQTPVRGAPDDTGVFSAGSAIDAAVASALPHDTADLSYEATPNGDDQREEWSPVADYGPRPDADLGL